MVVLWEFMEINTLMSAGYEGGQGHWGIMLILSVIGGAIWIYNHSRMEYVK